MRKSVEFDVKIYDNKIEIIPLEEVDGNHNYEITIEDIQAKNSNRSLERIKYNFTTEMYPCFVSLESVKSLVEDLGLDDNLLLYYIREASEEAEYRSSCPIDYDKLPFWVRQYVRYKAAYDALFRTMLSNVPEAGYSGTLADITFNNPSSQASAKSVLNELKGELDKWKQEVENCGQYGYAEPRRTIHHIRNRNHGHHVNLTTIGRLR
ncbi:hypothetical protein [Kurthia sp. Dielmo]|uniref:hypothetical protein n=1 Tax=Kurthia sp. Dielmo TaxID=1033738 RepID=UPI00111F4C91|nr:hypothetical protein [Kurthia sp. Dielmo]